MWKPFEDAPRQTCVWSAEATPPPSKSTARARTLRTWDAIEKRRRCLRTPSRRSAALIAVVLLAACGHPAKHVERETVNAPTAVVQRASVPAFHTVAGTVKAETTSTLAANVVGTVVRVRVAEGDRVRAGDVLVEIDARETRANVDRVRAGREEIERAIDAATANAQLAEKTFHRFEALRERGSASPQEFDEAKSRHAAAQAELARLAAKRGEARAAATQAEAVLAYTSIRAPIDGVITARFLDPGAQAAPGVPLVAIESESATRVDANVPEHVSVRAGDRALVDDRFEARVTHVQPSVDPAARSAVVKLQLAKPMRAGAFVRVAFTTGKRDAITVPDAALVRHGQLTSVFVVGSDGVAHMRLVTLGSNAEVLSGLDAGETIVVDAKSVRDGVIVRSNA